MPLSDLSHFNGKKVACMNCREHVGVYAIWGTLLGVLTIRGFYDLGVHIGGPIFS